MKSPNQIFTKSPRPKLKPLTMAMLPLMYFGMSQYAIADTLYWDGTDTTSGNGSPVGGSGNWNTSSNWTSDTSGTTNQAWGDGDNAVFGGTGGTVTLDSAQSVGDITFNSDGYILTKTNNANAVLFANPVNTYTVTNADDTATIENIVGMYGGISPNALTKLGDGKLILSGTKNYSGDTTIFAGTLETRGFVIHGNIINNGTYIKIQEASTTSTRNSNISGSGNFIKSGSGNLILSSSNTYTGSTTVNGGKLVTRNLSALGNNSAVSVNNGALAVESQSLTIGSLGGTGGMVDIKSGQTLTTGADNTSTTYNGVILGSGQLTKQGAGSFILTGNNTYSGTTTISGGSLQIGNGGTTGSLGTGNIVNNSKLIFNRSDNTSYVGDITGTGTLTKEGAGTLTLSGSNTFSGNTSINDGTLQIGNGGTSGTLGTGNVTNNSTLVFNRSDDSSYAGVISGTGTVTKEGVGTLTLSGNNSYSGTTTISDGTLQIGDGGTSGTLGTGDVTNNSALIFNRSDDSSYAGVISGTGTVTKEGAGTLTLTGTNTYSGGTTINDGTISIGAAANLGSGGLTLDGGTLQTTASFTSSRGAALGASGGSFNIDAGTTLRESGTISGSGRLTKTGEGTLILSGSNNTFTGGTVVSDGRLIALGGGAIGRAGNITNNAIVEFQIGLNAGALHYDQISGTGSLIKSGAGNVILNGNNTYTGGTTISEGILSIGGTAGSITGNILNNAELWFFRTNDYTFAGDISGMGNVRSTGSGTTTTLTGNNTYSGITNVVSGTLQIGDGGTTGSLGTGNVNNSGTLAFNRSDDSGYAGVISGTGAVTQNGTGNFNLTGTNTYTGATTVNAGILSVNGSISNSTTTVNSGGTLGGTGTVGDVFINGGTFAPGNSIGTINVSGDVDFTGGGNYDVEVDAAGNSDKIVATGSATLTGGIVNVKAAPGTYAYATDYTILTATGGLGGTTFDSVNANLAFLTPTLSYDANNVFLKLTRNSTNFSDVASTRNQRAVAMAIDNNTSQLSDLVSQITPLSSLAARQAFDSLSGVQHSNNQLITRSVASQFNQLLLNHGSQSGSGSLAFNNQLNASGMNSGSASVLPQQRGWWAQGFGSFNDIDDTHNARGADYQTSGLAFGIDADWHEFVMGVAGSYARTDVDPYSGNSTIDSYQAATYGSWQQDQLYVNASLGFGLHKVDASRRVTMGSSVSTAKADYDSFDINSTIETGKDFALGADTTLTPFAGVSYLYNSRDGFTEKGAGAANLKVDKENDESLLTSIGLRLSHDIHMADKRILTPVASIAYVHEHMDSVSTLNANFKNVSGSNFSIDGPELDRDRLQLALGVTGQLTSSTSLVLGYYGEFADSHQNNALTATLDVSF